MWLYLSHFAKEFDNKIVATSPDIIRLSELGCCRCLTGWRPVLCVMRKNRDRFILSHRIADQLSPHHDSQFSAFSTEVFIRMNRKHNRSSSPFTSIAERAEHKVVTTGARQPNYWPKTWFGADAYNAIFKMPNYTIKVFGLILFLRNVRGRMEHLTI